MPLLPLPLLSLLTLVSPLLSLAPCSAGTAHCLTCASTHSCGLCAPLHTLASQSHPEGSVQVCVPCMPGCVECAGAVCLGCLSGFVLAAGVCECPYGRSLSTVTQGCQSCGLAQCVACSADGATCLQCSNGYGLQVGGNGCVPCTDANCLQCPTNPTKCQKCAGNTGVSSSHGCQTCLDVNCDVCPFSSSLCIECRSSYGVSMGSCVACPLGCLQCGPSITTCTKCAPQYGLVLAGFNAQTCQRCLAANCLNCQQNYRQCTDCMPGYSFHPLGICQNCDYFSRCINCPIPSAFQCLQCASGLMVRPDTGYCDTCPFPNCDVCTHLACFSCQIPYSYDSGACSATCANSTCLQCPEGPATCLFCAPGYGVASATNKYCIACSDTQCQQCPLDYTRCVKCRTLYGVNPALGCSLCTLAHCLNCQSDLSTCLACSPGYGLSVNQCVIYSVPNCLQCPTDASTCMACLGGYYQSSGLCVPCADPCLQCSTSATACSLCLPGYYYSAGACIACGPYCQACTHTGECTLCSVGLLATSAGCVPCADVNCLRCEYHTGNCTLCASGFGVDGGGCSPCVNNTICEQCPYSVNACMHCVVGYGLSGTQCLPCAGFCLQCSPLNHTHCLQCALGSTLVNSTCLPCPSTCPDCSLSSLPSNCSVCYPAPIPIPTAGSQCSPLCMPPCSLCMYIIATTYDCLACEQYYQPIINTSTLLRQCDDICGDGVIMHHPCDLPKGVAYDGCTDECQVEAGFVCGVGVGGRQCSYTRQLQLGFSTVTKRQAQGNEFVLVLSYFPPLEVLRRESEWSGLLVAGNSSWEVQQVQVNAVDNTFIVYGRYGQNFIASDPLSIRFQASPAIDPRFTLTPTVSFTFLIPGNQQPQFVFLSSNSLLLAGIITYWSYALVAVMYISAIVSAARGRLGGLQSAMVVQLVWLNLLWLNGYLGYPLASGAGLKYASGYNVHMVEQSASGESVAAPYISQFGLSADNFANSINLVLILPVVPLLVLLINKARMHIHRKHTQKCATILKHIEYCAFLLLYLSVFNLPHLTSCLCLFFTAADANMHSQANVVLIVLFCGVTGCALLGFLHAPDAFGEFRYAYRTASQTPKLLQLVFNHFLIYTTVYVAALLTIIKTAGVPYLPLTLLLLLIVYTCALRPYRHAGENARHVFNLLVLCVVVSQRIYYHHTRDNCVTIHLWSEVWMVVSYGVMGAVVLWGLLSPFYCEYRVRKQREEQDEAQARLKAKEAKVLQMLEMTHVGLQMSRLQDEGNVFKQVLPPHASILGQSNLLHDLNQESQRQLKREVKDWRRKALPSEHTKPYQHNQINSPDSQLIDLDSEYRSIGLNELANQVLVTENRHINFRHARVQLDKRMPEHELKNIFLQFYSHIQ